MLLNLLTLSDLDESAQAYRNVSLSSVSDEALLVTANTTQRLPSGVFFGSNIYSDCEIPVSTDRSTMIRVSVVGKYLTSNSIYQPKLWINYLGRNMLTENYTLSSDVEEIVATWIPTRTPIQIGMLFNRPVVGDSFMISSVQVEQIYTNITTVNLDMIPVFNVNLSDMIGKPSGTINLLTESTDITLTPVAKEPANGTSYRLIYNFNSSDTTVGLSCTDGRFVGKLGDTNIDQEGSVSLRSSAKVGDIVDLVYYNQTWIISGQVESLTPYSLPVVTITELTASTHNPNVNVECNVSGSGDTIASITETGFCWSESNTTPDINDSKDAGPLPDVDGNFTVFAGSVEPFFVNLYGRAYAINPVGVGYSEVVTFETGICLAEGTMITLADLTEKPIEQISYYDKLLVWDFDNSKFDVSCPFWIKQPETTNQLLSIEFSNGKILNTVGFHRVFNVEQGRFTYPHELKLGFTHTLSIGDADADADTINTTDTSSFPTSFPTVKCIKIHKTEMPIKYYNIITDRHLNFFAESICTSCRYNNIYPIVNLKFDKPVVTDPIFRENTENIPEEYWKALRMSEQKDLSDSAYVDRLIRKKLPL